LGAVDPFHEVGSKADGNGTIGVDLRRILADVIEASREILLR
jgi:hypothetical protein